MLRRIRKSPTTGQTDRLCLGFLHLPEFSAGTSVLRVPTSVRGARFLACCNAFALRSSRPQFVFAVASREFHPTPFSFAGQ